MLTVRVSCVQASHVSCVQASHVLLNIEPQSRGATHVHAYLVSEATAKYLAKYLCKSADSAMIVVREHAIRGETAEQGDVDEEMLDALDPEELISLLAGVYMCM